VLIERREELPRLIRIFRYNSAGTRWPESDRDRIEGFNTETNRHTGAAGNGSAVRHIYLDLHVKVRAAWREKAAYLNTVDWRTMSGRDET
jgi:hypothetical protein